MKVKNENFTPRERVNRELLDRMLAEGEREDANLPLPPYPSTIPYPSTPAMACSCRNQGHCPVHPIKKAPMCSDKEAPDTALCRTPVRSGVSLAMVYSPCQAFADLFEAEVALEHGTIFKELDLPFYPTPCNERWCR